MTGKDMYSLITGAAFVAGVGFCLIGMGSAVYFPHFRKHAIQTSGVIKNLVRDDDKGDVYLCPEFSFQTSDGHSYLVGSHNCSNPSEFFVGESVSILYKSSDPTDAYIDSPGQFKNVAREEIETGSASLLVAITLFLYAKRTGRPIRWLGRWSS